MDSQAPSHDISTVYVDLSHMYPYFKMLERQQAKAHTSCQVHDP